MQSNTYTSFYADVLALTGNSSFTTTEQTRILANANRRLYQAYRSFSSWPRYIVGSELRPAVDSVISRDAIAGATYTISSATRSGTVVTITTSVPYAMFTGATVTIAGLSGTIEPDGDYEITKVSASVFTYDLDTGTGTETYSGSGTAVYAGISTVDSFNRIFRDNPLNLYSSVEYEFYVDVDGAHIINNFSNNSSFWVNYYKEWSGPYTAASTDIPLEFYRFAVHATYADYLRFDGQIDKAMAEENNAQQYLMLEIDKAENQRNVNSLQRRISTYNSRQSR